MITLLAASVYYFAIAFAAGVALGTLRELALRPMLGHGFALAIEIPLMLAVSWIAAGRTLDRFALPTRTRTLVLGLVAFTLLLTAEAFVFGLSTGRPASGVITEWMTPHGLAGLAAQTLFALFPALRWRLPHAHH